MAPANVAPVTTVGAGGAGAGAGGGPGRTTGSAVSAGSWRWLAFAPAEAVVARRPVPEPLPAPERQPPPALVLARRLAVVPGRPRAPVPGSVPGRRRAPAAMGRPRRAPPRYRGPGRIGAITGAAPAAGAPTPAICSTQLGPPVRNGVAAALGLNAKAAPHNPALATTAMLIRSNFLNDNSSHDRAQKVSPRTNGAVELYRRPEIFPRRAADLVAEPMRGGDVVTVSSPKRFATDEIGYR
ncbi:hypothetical protein MULP_03808 [Mycobacterium liflandii 128FXT]|uniref:Uncharacterized protein n=1 Tax=Mycobacterium liflandii (strain 128FXT) TaxID=459424 RepID=L7VAG8_MYCL1|nr:hypothetical protein MULP_03808 [Mycobacterium liflandii 128FXT]